MDKISIGLLGLGTVGGGVYQLLQRDNEAINRRLGAELVVEKILVSDLKKARNHEIDKSLLTADPKDVIDNEEIDIVVELIGGTKVAKELVEAALKKGKSVVTANKELIANHGSEIFDLAESAGVEIDFEASVAGGIPIIGPLKDSLVGNKIVKIMGIVNGTTNYILSKMSEGDEYDHVLAEAQELGYAERDPSADVSGDDAGAKIAILSSIAFNSRVTPKEVYTEGITSVSLNDIMYAYELGYAIKLVALAKKRGDELDVRVHPTMISLDHPLAKVDDVYNAIFVVGDAVGELMFFGKGAGDMPTASAVVGDIFKVAGNLKKEKKCYSTCTCFNSFNVKPIDEVESNFYILMEVLDRPGVLAKIAKILGEEGVSLGSVIQKQSSGNLAELVFMTHLVREGNLRSALSKVSDLEDVDRVCNVIRVETGEDG